MAVECIHIKDSRPGDYYCGRASSLNKASKLFDCSVLGNPFSSPALSREESIAKYKDYIHEKYFNNFLINEIIHSLVRKAMEAPIRLVCFCKPKACHTDILKEMIDGFVQRRKEELINDDS